MGGYVRGVFCPALLDKRVGSGLDSCSQPESADNTRILSSEGKESKLSDNALTSASIVYFFEDQDM